MRATIWFHIEFLSHVLAACVFAIDGVPSVDCPSVYSIFPFENGIS